MTTDEKRAQAAGTAQAQDEAVSTGQQLAMTAAGMQRTGERLRRGRVEAERDREVLEWIGRFRFVTCELLGERFGVSVQAMRTRIRRLEQLGDVVRASAVTGQARAIYLAPAGARRIGSRRHRAPRFDSHRAHELAVAKVVSELERAARTDLEILTERDARDREGDGRTRYSVDVLDASGVRSKRWPDVLIASPTRTVAVEVEFAEKSSERLRGILDSYLASTMTEVRFLVSSPTLAARLSVLAAQQARGMADFAQHDLCAITIHPWTGVSPEVRAAIHARLA